MNVSVDTNSGFCFGVTNAIRQAEEGLAEGRLYCLGDIVHNSEEVKRLDKQGLVTIDYDDLRTLRNVTVLLRAHGEPPSTYRIAEQNNIRIIDATCPVVLNLQKRIRETYQATREAGAQIVIYGTPGHAEVVGLCGQTNNTAIVIEDEADITRIDMQRDIYLFSQTTKSEESFRHLVEVISSRAQGRFEYRDTICRSVANRVKQLQDFARQHDLVIFVGGRKSSNAQVLFRHAQAANPNTRFVSSPDEVTSEMLEPMPESVGVCGATSTPRWLMQECAERAKGCAAMREDRV
ncbi:MAG: 4-hydroxy-3-methylbut-2-enyl diphosphate reductase [Paludibacteraceae bacterium]|nr:4-hydroxy-3-methylbut-2-enyl diphosphate reductase [Paludibacteraceae bacterium]